MVLNLGVRTLMRFDMIMLRSSEMMNNWNPFAATVTLFVFSDFALQFVFM